MKIEGYMKINWRGQFRFSLSAFDNKLGPLERSDRQHDYHFDAGMRQHPTLYEMVLIEEEREFDHSTTEETRQVYEDEIYKALRHVYDSLKNARNAKFIHTIPNGVVEFVVVS